MLEFSVATKSSKQHNKKSKNLPILKKSPCLFRCVYMSGLVFKYYLIWIAGETNTMVIDLWLLPPYNQLTVQKVEI